MSFLRRAMSSSPVIAVQLLSGRTIKGALVDRRSYGLVLRAAMVSDEDAAHHVTWTRLDGDVVVPHDQVEFYQSDLNPAILASPLG